MDAGLVHDYLLVLRGAERTFGAIAECWPSAPIYTTLYSPEGTDRRFAAREIRTSWLQRLRLGQRGFRALLPLYPRAVERLDLGAHELVVSSSSAFAHGVRPGRDAIHVCYCHTPFRYAWYERPRALAEAPVPLRRPLNMVLDRIQAWDVEAAGRVTSFIANSELTRRRIAACYEREAAVVHPPVEVERFSLAEAEDYALVVAELVAHKRVDVALEAAARAGLRVKVVGDGPELGRLEALHGENAEFLGRVSDSDLPSLYSRALVFVVANVEEFGIAAVEAQAAGRPVVAIGAGGALETVIDGETGVLVAPGRPEELGDALRETDFRAFDPRRVRENALRFSTARFKQRLLAEVARAGG